MRSIKNWLLSNSYLALIFVLGLGNPSSVLAQEIDHQFWMNYALSIPISEQLSWGGDIGVRGVGSNQDWNQILIRPAITYKFKKPFSVAGAMAWFGTFNDRDYNISEFRIHQDFNAKWPDLGFIEFFYRVRIEQRFFFYQNSIDNAFKVRLRGLIGVETQDLTWFGSKRPIYFQSIYEGFRTLDQDEAIEVFINSTRFHLAFGQRVSKSFRYELHYIAQRSRLFSEDGTRAAQNIYRIRLFQRLKSKAK